MAERFEKLNDKLKAFIRAQHIYFVGTAGAEGYVNVSPKGMDSFRILDDTTVAWLNLTGSGNETAAHVLENGRMTVMFCSFDKQPLIMRLYGRATAVHPRDTHWGELSALFPTYTGARQIFVLHLDLVQTSCGYAVPYYTLKGERPTLTKWSDQRGEAGIQAYWAEQNRKSLNDKDTGIG
ncbi:MAG: pyridoxamine 5'-phosphate oxidase family protein [Halioglobus sp.]